jgi:hypothetical protein
MLVVIFRHQARIWSSYLTFYHNLRSQLFDLDIENPFWYFWYFWLTIQNITNRHVSNAFDLIAAFISFPLVRAAAAAAAANFFCCCCCAPPLYPAPFYFGGREEGSTKKENGLWRRGWRLNMFV